MSSFRDRHPAKADAPKKRRKPIDPATAPIVRSAGGVYPALFQNTVRALNTMLPLDKPADVAISQFFRANPALGQQDRNWLAEAVFGVLRHGIWLNWRVPNCTPRQLLVVYLRLVRGLPQRELASVLTEEETAWLAAILAETPGEAPLYAQAELPEWVVTQLQASMQDADIVALGRSLKQSAPLDLRVNTMKDNRDALLSQLTEMGFTPTATPFSPIGLRLVGRPAIQATRHFKEGVFEVQDEGSQLLGMLLAPRRSEKVVDFCAGAGGKTLLLGAMMSSTGRLYAFDISEKRIQRLGPRLQRSGLTNVQPEIIAHENDKRISRLYGKIDRVLVDAPCSGLGTLRRNPDLKWRQSPNSVSELVEKQASILASAAKLLRVGGRLVYGTCSILPAENQAQVDHFLATHPDFIQLDASEVLAQAKVDLPLSGASMQLTPQQHATDGFFAAVFEKQAPAAAPV